MTFLLTNVELIAGLLLSSGRKWHQRRKIITPSFHFKILEHFTEIMESQGQVFVSNLKKTEGQHFDFFPAISLYALDVICGKEAEERILGEQYLDRFLSRQNPPWAAKLTRKSTPTRNMLRL